MKPIAALLFAFVCLGAVQAGAQTAGITLRPSHIDISSADAQSAVLVTLSDYTGNDARYRLYRLSTQYNPWDADSAKYVTATAYGRGPRVPGTPSTSTTFWIMFQRGNNESAHASYRDRLGPEYSDNNLTAELPVATEITNAFYTTHDDVGFAHEGYEEKLVVLGFDEEEEGVLVTAASTDPGSGHFSLTGPVGTVLKRIELRRADNSLVESKTGQWPEVQQAVTPVFSPEAGIFRGGIKVELHTPTTGAQIRYTLNGGDPDENSALYSDALDVHTDTQIKARAFKDQYVPSEVSNAHYRILDNEHWETFDGFEYSSSSYADGQFAGQDGGNWRYVQCAGSLQIDGRAITLGRNRPEQSFVESGRIEGGIGTLEFNYMQAFTTNVNLDVYVNDQLMGSVSSDSEQHLVKHSGRMEVNLGGEAVIRFIGSSNSSGQVTIDNVIWDGFDGPTSAAGPMNPQPSGRVESPAQIYASRQILTIRFAEEQAFDRLLLQVLDMSGRQRLAQTIDATTSFSRKLDLETGLYVVRLISKQGVQTEKIFFENN